MLALETGTPAIVTLHPSAVLRAGESRDVRLGELRTDLELARATLDELLAAVG